uniref:Helitron helicase-like domain-containing protein n=1 Tax=Strigamia maritima TaxID=126957 RepID=T1JFD9_STRMM
MKFLRQQAKEHKQKNIQASNQPGQGQQTLPLQIQQPIAAAQLLQNIAPSICVQSKLNEIDQLNAQNIAMQPSLCKRRRGRPQVSGRKHAKSEVNKQRTERAKERRAQENPDELLLRQQIDSDRHKPSYAELPANELLLRQQLDADRHKQSYAELPANELLLRQQLDADRHKQSYNELPTHELLLRQQLDADRHKQSYTELPAHELLLRQQLDADRHKQSYAKLPANELLVHQQLAKERQRENRATLTVDEISQLQQINSEMRRESRAELPTEQVAIIRQLDTERHRESRAAYTHDEFAHQRKVNRELQQQCRQRQTAARKIKYHQLALSGDFDSFELFSAGPLNGQCKIVSCKALHFAKENISKHCCSKGKVQLPPLQPFPFEIRKLMEGNDDSSKNFRKCIRQYNSALAFVSMYAEMAAMPAGSRRPYCFKIHGQMYHRASSFLRPTGDQIPAYAQLYIFDAA